MSLDKKLSLSGELNVSWVVGRWGGTFDISESTLNIITPYLDNLKVIISVIQTMESKAWQKLLSDWETQSGKLWLLPSLELSEYPGIAGGGLRCLIHHKESR